MGTEVKTDIKTFSVFDEEEFQRVTRGIQVSQLMKLRQSVVPANEDISHLVQELNVSDCLFCSYCSVAFPDQSQQRQHYKLDWHRYNLKQHLANKKLVSEERFVQITENDDMSSISGSESESDSELSSVTESEELSDERVSHLLERRAKILFENQEGQMISLYQCLLHNKKTEPPSEEQLVSLTQHLPTQNCWLLIMLGGGHMAAAVFKGTEAIRHKTFHSYTVRAKQGGSQSSKDSSGRHAKSAGASLRRYNEQSLTQHVQEMLSTWSVEINACQLIFYRAVGPFNRGVLFGGKSPPLNKSDPRLRTVPFPTRRATFSELQRVHTLLASVLVYDSVDIFKSTLMSPRRGPIRVKEEGVESASPGSPKRGIDRAKARPSPDRALPDFINALAAIETSESGSDREDHVMTHNDLEISFNDCLQEFEDSVPREVKKKKRKKKDKPPEKEVNNDSRSLRRKVLTACEAGDVRMLLLSLQQEGSVVSDEDRIEALEQLTNEGLTLLQSAAQRGIKDLVWALLENGASPCVKDKKAMTAYDFAPDKDTRNTFRRFMGEFPDKHDYSRSHIPSALTTAGEREQAERRREAKKKKREKEKERKIADEPRRQEEAEKKRFLELSDREKRALAAERRLLAASGRAGVVLTRCYVCAIDITGKVPFTYDNFLFCSMPCLKSHRSQHKQIT